MVLARLIGLARRVRLTCSALAGGAPARAAAWACALAACICVLCGEAALADAGNTDAGDSPLSAPALRPRTPFAQSSASKAQPVYGLTIDDTAQLGTMLPALSRLPRQPRVRVYFDVHRRARSYRRAVRRLSHVGRVMGELLDSSDERAISVAGLRHRANAYVRTLGSHVAIWEIGNEVNGDWTGRPATVAAKLTAAYDVVRAHGGRTALTLYANAFGRNHCGDGRSELTPREFTRRWVPARVARGLDEVLLSYYPTQCGGRLPSARVVAKHLRALHALYPHARLGFGEVGLPNPVTAGTASLARRIMRWAYALNPHLPYYVGGYFWWYAAEDALRPGALLTDALRRAFAREHRVLG